MRACPLPFSRLFAALAAVAVMSCGEDGAEPTAPAPESALAVSGVVFRQIDAAFSHACGVATDDRAYCWGSNDQGQLGTGSTTGSGAPALVAGGHRFRHVTVGFLHSCGVTTEHRAYCWGFNFDGQLGDGTGYPENTRRLTPVAVAGDRRFRQIRAGHAFTCALTPSDAAFCWGHNTFGQLGDGTREDRPVPVRVKGGLEWRQINAGEDHICGVTQDDRAYCWGMGFWGQLGNGTQEARGTPTRVAGGLLVRQISAGRAHSCAVTDGNRAYCWGKADEGQLGDGSAYPPVLSQWSPVAVATTLKFDHVMAGGDHTCGVTQRLRVFCWGWNAEGRLGIGSTGGRRLTPSAVDGSLLVSQVVPTPSISTYALTSDGQVYRWGGNVSSPVPVFGP